MENHNYDEIIANPQAPYINALASGGALLTNYTALTQLSQPNYLALFAGSTFGVTADVAVTETGPTLATVLAGAGKTFVGYVEHPATSFDHNPWESFPGNPNVERDFTTFPSANFASLPTVSFIAPNINDDMHNGTIQQGDTWLQANLGSYAQWAQANNSLLVVVWDENGAETGIPIEPSNQVAAILYGAHVAPGTFNTAYNHYNMLSTILGSYGLAAPNNAARPHRYWHSQIISPRPQSRYPQEPLSCPAAPSILASRFRFHWIKQAFRSPLPTRALSQRQAP